MKDNVKRIRRQAMTVRKIFANHTSGGVNIQNLQRPPNNPTIPPPKKKTTQLKNDQGLH